MSKETTPIAQAFKNIVEYSNSIPSAAAQETKSNSESKKIEKPIIFFAPSKFDQACRLFKD